MSSPLTPESQQSVAASDAAGTPAQNPAAAPEAAANGWERDALRELLQIHLSDRKSERRWKWVRRGLLLATIALVIVLAWQGTRSDQVSPSMPHTAMVAIDGEIAYESSANATQIIEALRDAFEDKGARAVVMVINSPGGSPVQAGIIHDEVRRLRKLHDKPVYAVVEDVCASAAYYIAASADQIYVDKASLVGSIGVIMDGFGFTGTMKKLGVERRLITAGENKGFLDPFGPEKPREREHAQALVNRIHQQFQQVVINGRGDRLADPKGVFTGLIWTGDEAVQKGLADGLGSLDSVAREVVGAEEIIDYTLRENVAERIAKQFGASLADAAVKTLATPSVR